MTIALQPPPVNTPITDKDGQVNALWSRFYVDLNQTVTLDVAPADGPYLTTTSNPSLTAETSLGLLSSGHISIAVAAGVAAVTSSATIPAADLTGALPALDASALVNLNATALASGTVPDGRFPATLPGASGVNLTALNASNLASGTVPDGRFPATLPALNGSALTSLTSTNIVHQVVTKVFADSPYTVLATDFSVLVNATGGAVTVTLPTPTSGRLLAVKKLDAVNTVTLTGTVDGVVNPTLTVQYQSRILQGDGANWQILGGFL